MLKRPGADPASKGGGWFISRHLGWTSRGRGILLLGVLGTVLVLPDPAREIDRQQALLQWAETIGLR